MKNELFAARCLRQHLRHFVTEKKMWSVARTDKIISDGFFDNKDAGRDGFQRDQSRGMTR